MSIGRARGQSLVEFGLVVILFAWMVSGIFDFGVLLNGWISLSTAARDGARQASVGVVPATLKPQIEGQSFLGVTSVKAVITYTDSNGATISSGSLATAYGGSCASNCQHPDASVNDRVTVAVTGNGQITTYLVRLVVQGLYSSQCPANGACNFPLGTKTSMRFEGVYIK